MYYANKAIKELMGKESPKIVDRKESLLERHFDAVLILGNGNQEEDSTKEVKSGLNIDGKSYLPSPDGLARLVAGAELFRNGITPLLIFSGGPSMKGSDITEAQIAFHFLTQVGYEVDGKNYKVPAEALMIDDKAMDTSENLLNSQKFIDKHRVQSLGIVSSGYHLGRIGVYAEDLLKGVKKVNLLASEDILGRTQELANKYPTTAETVGSKLLEVWAKGVDFKGKILGEAARVTRR